VFGTPVHVALENYRRTGDERYFRIAVELARVSDGNAISLWAFKSAVTDVFNDSEIRRLLGTTLAMNGPAIAAAVAGETMKSLNGPKVSIETPPPAPPGKPDNNPRYLYRTGSQTDNALTDPSGVSFRDSATSSANKAQVFKPGDKIWVIDTTKLPPGSVIRDGVPPGHVSIRATPEQIRAATIPVTPENPLFGGLKPLEDGRSFRLPK
jgi:hypothetical protein